MKNIELIAPSSGIPDLKETQLKILKKELTSLNLNLVCSSCLLKKSFSFLSAPDTDRLSALENAFTNDKTQIILPIRGGYGSARLLDKINYHLIKQHPKMLLGFSDTTALQNALFTKAGLVSYSGFLACYGLKKISLGLKENLKKTLENKKQTFKITPLTKGKVQGTLVGGNLSVFLSLLSTPYFPNMKDKILVLEEVNEAPYKIDRMLNQLKLAGVFTKVRGVILGDMSARVNPSDKKEIHKICLSYFASAPYPVGILSTYSHAKPTIILPIGGEVVLDTKKSILTLDKRKKIN